MKTAKLFLTLPVMGALSACQSETPQANDPSGRILTVRASLPDSDDTRGWIAYGKPEEGATRAQITYGNRNPEKETFMWDQKGYGGLSNNDCIALYNFSRLSQCPSDGIQLDVIKTDGRTATFESVGSVDPNLEIKAGDLIFVNYWETGIEYNSSGTAYDERKIFSIGVGSQSNKPQYVVRNPNDSSLAYMQSNLKMYDIVKVVEDDRIPDLHFRPLSAIMRVSLRNETDSAIYPTSLEFEYPGTKSFFNTTLYCSVDTTLESGLKVYDDSEIMDGSEPYTDKIATTVNGKDGTKDAGDSIAPGQTYDLYLSVVPRIGNTAKGEKLIVSLIKKHQTDNPFTMTLDGFDVPIVAGKRYWFNLTAVKDADGTRKLMLTSKWLEDHPGEKPYYE